MAKRALLFGINRYKIPGADLRGCVNDVNNVEKALQKWCGFSKSGIRKITDFRCTTQRMKKEIAKLIGNAKRGDVLYLHYSGHGSNVPDKDGDEADARDEILCPTDLDWKKPLTDDWIGKQFDRLPKGVNLTVVFDSCHSGTATRAIGPPDEKIKSRYLPSPRDLVAVESGRSLRGTVKRGRKKRRRKRTKRGNITIESRPEVFISGCKDNQTSADAYIRGSYNGALSYNLVATLNARRGRVSMRDLHRETLKRVKRGGYRQTPQVFGSAANLSARFLSPYA